MEEISPLETSLNILRRWWWVALCILLGGLFAWIFHRMRPPVYEAVASFTAVIDYGQAMPITEREQDQAIGAFMAVLTARPLLDRVSADVQETLTAGQNVSVERVQSVIELRARHTNPVRAAEIANRWAEQAYAELVEASGHAQHAANLQKYLNGLLNCLQAAPVDPGPLCSSTTLADLEQRRQEVEVELQAELLAGKALLPALVFDYASPAEAPAAPVSYSLTWLILAGVLIGGVVGVTIATVFPVSRRLRQ